MKKKLNKTITIILSAAMILGVTACGTEKENTETKNISSEKEVKTAEISLVAENAPFTYEGDDGNPAGYDYEVLKLIDDYLEDWEFNFTVIDYETSLAGTTNGKYDMTAGAYFRTDAREKSFAISEPYNYFFLNLVVKADSGITSLEDLNEKSIAPIVGTDGRTAALNDWIESHPETKIDFTPLASSGAMADEIAGVEDGIYDAAYLSKEQAEAIFEEAGYTDLNITDIVDGRDTTFLMYNKDSELQEAINKAIASLTEDGTLGQLTEKWFGQNNFDKASELGLR